MLRCASSFVIAVYATVRLIPQDRERKPEAPLVGDGAQERTGLSSLPGLAARRAVSQSRALPAAFLRSRPISATFKTFYEVVKFSLD